MRLKAEIKRWKLAAKKPDRDFFMMSNATTEYYKRDA